MTTNPVYSKLFIELGCGSLVVGVVLVLLIPFLRKLITDGKEAAPEEPVVHGSRRGVSRATVPLAPAERRESVVHEQAADHGGSTLAPPGIDASTSRLRFEPCRSPCQWSYSRRSMSDCSDGYAATVLGTELETVEAQAPRAVLAKRYELLGLLGAGAMGTVYRAHDRELDEIVALKVLKKELAGSPDIRERFRSEVKLARRVTHRNVARTFDIGEDAGDRFLTMELIDGESLAHRLATAGRMPLGEVVAIAKDICAGLARVHRHQRRERRARWRVVRRMPPAPWLSERVWSALALTRVAAGGAWRGPMSEPAYLIGQIDTADLAQYRAVYGKHVVPLIGEHGGELIVGSPDAEILEGTWSGTWTVVIRFPSREAALAFYESPAYAPYKRARIETLTNGGNLVLVPGRK